MGPTLALLTVLQANKLEDNEDIVGTRNGDFIQKVSRPRRWQASISKKPSSLSLDSGYFYTEEVEGFTAPLKPMA